MIRTIDLGKVYKGNSIETVALRQINLEVGKGEFVCIMGPSGCGKTTLLNLLGLLDEPSSGKQFFLNEDITRISSHRRALLRRQHIGFVFQNFNLIEELNIYENVELPLLYQGVAPAERKLRVEALLERLQLAHKMQQFPHQLSGGQQQRIAVARAIVGKPKLILADEPTGNLDSTQGQQVMEMLQELNEKGTTIVMVTHSNAATDFCSRVVNLFDGQLVTDSIWRTPQFHTGEQP
jgi:putative ABC transport system ATP-binding protein